MNLSMTYETIRYYYDRGILISEYLPSMHINYIWFDEGYYMDNFNYNAF